MSLRKLKSLGDLKFPVVEVKCKLPIKVQESETHITIGDKILIKGDSLLSSFNLKTVNQIETRCVYPNIASFVIKNFDRKYSNNVFIDANFKIYVCNRTLEVEIGTSTIKLEDDFFILGNFLPYYFIKEETRPENQPYILYAKEDNQYFLIGYTEEPILSKVGNI